MYIFLDQAMYLKKKKYHLTRAPCNGPKYVFRTVLTLFIVTQLFSGHCFSILSKSDLDPINNPNLVLVMS